MTLPLIGNISLSNIALEFSDTSPYRLSEFYRGGDLVPSAPPTTANIPTSGTIRFSNFYGAAVAARISLTLEVRSPPTGNNYVNSFDVYDLFQSNTTLFPQYSNGATDLTVNVQSGQIVRGNSSPLFGTNYTVKVPAAFITPGNKVTMNVHGFILGKGGQGGASFTPASPQSGYPGGSALFVAPVPSPGPNKVVNINVFPTGTIAGGGGGGGGGSPRFVPLPVPPKGGPSGNFFLGGGGGGGAGSVIGTGGPGFPGGALAPSSSNTGAWPTTYNFGNAAGSGALGSPSPQGTAGTGGSGGNLGNSGGAGGSVTYAGAPGGAAGNSIVGQQQVNIVTGGPRIYGPQINS